MKRSHSGEFEIGFAHDMLGGYARSYREDSTDRCRLLAENDNEREFSKLYGGADDGVKVNQNGDITFPWFEESAAAALTQAALAFEKGEEKIEDLLSGTLHQVYTD
jgi:hypothetical protein